MKALLENELLLYGVFIGGTLVLILIGYYVSSFLKGKRMRAVRDFAVQAGLEFTEGPVPNFSGLSEPSEEGLAETERELEEQAAQPQEPMSPEEERDLQSFADALKTIKFPKGVHLYTLGDGMSTASNVARGKTGAADFFLFDYEYTVSGGRSSTKYEQTVCHFQSGKLKLPELAMRPESLWHKVGSVMGYQDIDFDSHPGFSKSYLLRGKDESAIRSAMRPDLLSFFEGAPGLCVEGAGDTLIVYRERTRTDADDLRSVMEEASEVYRRFTSQVPGT